MPRQKSIVLIHPPASVLSEAPAGIARLAGFLGEKGVDCRVIDLNIEAICDMVEGGFAAQVSTVDDTWTRRAKFAAHINVAALRSPRRYESLDRYKRAVMDVNRLLHMAGREKGVHLSLSNYAEAQRMPVRSRDLADAAADFESNLFFPFFGKKLSQAFSEALPDIVGISVNFLGQALCASAIAGYIRKRFPSVRIVFGGGLVTSWMKIPGVSTPLKGIADDMVSGPGERPLAAMCGIAENDRNGIPGFPYDYGCFDLDKYLSPGIVLPISASDGCYWRKCSFCPEKAEKKKYRHYPPIEMARLPDGHAGNRKPALVHFVDNALSPRFMKYLIDNPPGIPWYGFARITRHLSDPEFTAGLAASGCVLLKVGIESGDQGVLDAMGKGTRLEEISGALKTLTSSGISVYGYLLFGTPGEDEKKARKTMDFIVEHSEYIDFLNLAIFNLPAYCDAAADLETRPFYRGDLSLYREFAHPLGWDRHRVRVFLEKSFKADPAIRKIINSDPPFFTSNHAPFFRMHPTRK